MRIKGEVIDEVIDPQLDNQSIYKKLSRLSSSFSAYHPIHPDTTKPVRPEAQAFFDEGRVAYREQRYKDANLSYSFAFKELELEPNVVMSGNIWCQSGHVMYSSGQYDKAIEHYNDAMECYVKTNGYSATSNVAKWVAEIHKINGNLAEFVKTQNDILEKEIAARGTAVYNQDNEIIARKYLAASAELSANLTEKRKHLDVLFGLEQGPLAVNVAYVGEQEVGWSDSVPLGTDNILQCMVIIVRDPKTNKTAMVHFNSNADPELIKSEVLNKFPTGTQLNVHLIGSRESMGRETSNANFNKVLNILKDKPNISIVSSDIWTDQYPSAIIFDPKTGKLSHGVPFDNHPDQKIHSAILVVSGSALNTAFDLTEGKTARNAIHLTAQSMDKLKWYDGKTADQIYNDKVLSSSSQSLEWCAMAASNTIAIVEENRKVSALLTAAIQQQLIKAGWHKDTVREIISSTRFNNEILYAPKHIGEGSAALNKAIISYGVDNILLSVSITASVRENLDKVKIGFSEGRYNTLLQEILSVPKQIDAWSVEVNKAIVTDFTTRMMNEYASWHIIGKVYESLEKEGIYFNANQHDKLFQQILSAPKQIDACSAEVNKAIVTDFTNRIANDYASWAIIDSIKETLGKEGIFLNQQEQSGLFKKISYEKKQTGAGAIEHNKYIALLHMRPFIESALLNSVSPEDKAAKTHYSQLLDQLFYKSSRSDINTTDPNGHTLLFMACQNGDLKAVRQLLLVGADVNKPDKNGKSPLAAALDQGHCEVAKLLIEHSDIKINELNKYGDTLLHRAVAKENINAVKVLLASNTVDIEKTNEDGDAALKMAIVGGNKEIVKMLLDKDANLDVTVYGKSMLELAEINGHTEIAKLIQNRITMDDLIKELQIE
jgi:hypothetical protein